MSLHHLQRVSVEREGRNGGVGQEGEGLVEARTPLVDEARNMAGTLGQPASVVELREGIT